MKKIFQLLILLFCLLVGAQAQNIRLNQIKDWKDSVATNKALRDSIALMREILSQAGGGENNAVWGNITGTLSNQTDLLNALNAKQNGLSGTGYLKYSGTTPSYISSIPNSDLQNSTISGIALGNNLANLTATDGTLTFSGAYNGSTARTAGVNQANNFQWTGTHQFGSTVRFNGLINLNGNSGTVGQSIRVNSGGTGLEWYTPETGGGGSAAWGGITGTLSDQSDLNTALGLKLNSADFNSTFDTRFGTKSTTNLTEGTNLYYTTGRFDTRFATKTTTDLAEGTNLYWTNARGDARYPQLSGSYSNPSWITGLAWSKISSTPTSLSGYGITDAVPSSRTITINGTTFDLTANRSWTISASGVTLGQLNDSLAKYVKKDSVGELTTDSHLTIAPDGDNTKISLDNIDDITAGGDLSGTYPNPTVAKLNGQLPSYYLNRANHTGTQTASTISDFTTATQTVGDARYVKLADSSKFLRKEDSSKYVTPTAFNNGLASVKPSQPKFVGQEYYNYSGWPNLSDFAENTMSATTSGGNIVIPDANVSDFTKYLSLAKYACTNHWKIIMEAKRTSSPGGGGSGISLGMKSINTDAICSNAFYFNGTLQYFYNSNGAGWATSIGGTSSALTYANADTIRFEVERSDQKMTGTVENKTNASAVARSLSVDLNLTSDPVIPNTALPTIFAQGGGWQILKLVFTNTEVNTPNALLVGDSKTMGWGATKDSNTIYGYLKRNYHSIAVSGGFGDKISDMLLRLTELKAMHAKVVVLNSPGSNDIRFGRSVSATMADYATLRQAFIDDGSTVIDVSPCYESAQSLSALYQAWKAAYGSLPTSIDIFNIPRQYGLASDGIHLNDASNKAIAKRIMDLNLIEGAKN